MSALVQAPPTGFQPFVYPESDGRPMADNTKQFEWIVTIKEGIDCLLPNDFVAGDLFWYPVEGNPRIVQAPDVLVALGRPKGHRGSYKQWEEDHLAPQVVFEILSPGNSGIEMLKKLSFYNRYGVEEYYIYDPDGNELFGWVRNEDHLREIQKISGWISPRLGIRFEKTQEKLEIYRPDGQRFLTYAELEQRAKQAEVCAEQAKVRAEQAEVRAEQAKVRAEQAEVRAEQAEVKIEQERKEKEFLKQKLRDLGIDPDQVTSDIN